MIPDAARGFWAFAAAAYSNEFNYLANTGTGQIFVEPSFRDTLLEDGSTLEKTHKMLMSGVKKEFYLQDQELILRHRLKVADRYINGHYRTE